MTAIVDQFPGIGGSDVGAILGISPFATPLDVWRKKVLKQEDEDQGPVSATGAGKRFEPHILAAYRKTLPDGARMWTPERVVDGWKRYSLDAIVEQRGWLTVVDGKSTILVSEYGKDGTDQVPLYCAAQGHWYMDRFEAEQTDFPVIKWPHQTGLRDVIGLTPAEIVEHIGIEVFHVRYSLSFAKLIREKAEAFWTQYVLTETPPPAVDNADAKRLVRAVRGKTTPVTEEIVKTLVERDTLKKQLKELEERIDAHDFALRTAIGDAEAVIDPKGTKLVTLTTIEKGAYTVKPQKYRQLNTTKAWKDLNKP